MNNSFMNLQHSHINPLRIAFFLESLELGGAEQCAVALANQANKDGHCVDVIVVRKGGVLEDNLLRPINTVSLDCVHTRRSIVRLSKHLRKTKPDVIISFMDNANLASMIAVALSRVSIKVCASVHSPFEFTINKLSLVKRVIFKFSISFFYPRANAIICVSKGTFESLSSCLNGMIKNVEVISNPISVSNPFRETRMIAREGNAKFRFIYVGRLAPEKDISNLLVAFKMVSISVYSELLIYGDGPCMDQLQNEIEALGMEDSVVLCGFARNLEEIYRNADCLVLCSKYESFGNVLLEALSFGCRVISTDCPVGPREVLGDGRWGKLVPVGDPYALAEAMSACANENHSMDMQGLGEYLVSCSPMVVLDKYLRSVGLPVI
jgi:glycosyltransferase involved in cell wall biosynthesis